MEAKKRYGDGWEFLSASSRVILQSRWKMLWNYIICGRTPEFTISAWVMKGDEKKVGELKLFVNWKDLHGR